jgi:hypothetical protein
LQTGEGGKVKPNTDIKDWRGRDFVVQSVETVTGEEAAGMDARGWEPLILTLEHDGRLRKGYVSTADGSIHEAVRVDEMYPERGCV